MMKFPAAFIALAACSSSPAPQPTSEPARVAPAVDAATNAPIDAGSDAAVVVADAAVDAAPAGPVALPKKCAADSPVDEPCTSYGGTYRIKLVPRAGERCVLKKAVEAQITIDGTREYRGIGQATELAPLAKAIGRANADLRIGAAVRDGVCCVDLELSPKGVDAFIRVRLARGANIVSAKSKERLMKGNDMCDAELDVTAELVRN